MNSEACGGEYALKARAGRITDNRAAASDSNRSLDAHVAYPRACLNAIEYLKKFGYSGEQAYAILGKAPVEGTDERNRRHHERLRDTLSADWRRTPQAYVDILMAARGDDLALALRI